jgi:F-box-like
MRVICRRHSTSVAAQLPLAVSTLSGAPHPIHQLPVEILQKIFTCFAEPRSPGRDPFLQVYPEWITITYVCRHWRAVALNHHSLWGSITPNLSIAWLKVLMARSEPAEVDVELRVRQGTDRLICLCVDEAIALLSNCTRLRSLRLVGPRRDVCAVLDALRIATPVHSLSLSLWEPGPPVVLSENLFGGQAPIRHINFSANRCIVPPLWLLRGVTHFTSCEQIALLDLLDALRHMPALTHFTLQHCRAHWEDSDAPRDPLIELPHLEEFIVHADSPRYFVLLNQRLALPRGAKRRLELRVLAVAGWDRWLPWFSALLPTIESANGLQHIHLCGGAKDGTFRAWTGDAVTSFEDAELGLNIFWRGSPTAMEQIFTSPIFHLGALCDLLGAAKSGRFLSLEGDPAKAELPVSCWWRLLEKLSAVERLGLHPNVVEALHSALDDAGAPAILRDLQTVQLIPVDTAMSSVVATITEPRTNPATVRKGFISRIVPSKVAWPDAHPHTAAEVPSTHGTDNVLTSVGQSTGMHAENSLEGLIALLQGGAGQNRK